MANTKSAKKDLRRSAKRRVRNQSTKSELKTLVKRVRLADKGNATEAQAALKSAVKALDKAAEHGIIHKNQAARRKSRIAKFVASA